MERRTSGGSLNTFVFGILVGVALTLLLTTKKGRKLLKILTEEGAEKITKWEEMLKAAQEEVVEEDFAAEEEMVEVTGEAEDYVEPAEREVEEPAPAPQKTFEKIEPVVIPDEKKEPEPKKAVSRTQEKSEKEETKNTEKEEKPKTSRRFFRGVRKK